MYVYVCVWLACSLWKNPFETIYMHPSVHMTSGKQCCTPVCS